MMEYAANLPVLLDEKKAVILTTYGLYPGDSIQMLAKELTKKNIVIIDYCGIRGPASDGVLTLPSFLTLMFNYEKSAFTKIQSMEQIIKTTLDTKSDDTYSKIPPSKWYVPLNDIIRPTGERKYEEMKSKISVDPQRCKRCCLCARSCGRNCWVYNENGDFQKNQLSSKNTPMYNPDNCEFCLKCIHNCPEKAIYFSEKMKDKPRLNKAFYESLKKKLI
ncbi:hypothetical protein [Acetivibrio straminisolvens]|nr:hypothetical protein [Acetivibrio straminisolvens]